MGFVRDWIYIAADELKQPLRELAISETQDLLLRIRTEFCSGEGLGPIWHDLRSDFGVRWPEGWQEIGKYVGDAPCILVDETEPCAFRMANGIELANLLAESPGFEFYVVDDSLRFLFCHNDHDYLIGAGNAAGWLHSVTMRHRN